VVKAKEGFDFLGVHFRLCPVRKKNSKLKQFRAIWPSDRSIVRIKQRISEVVGRRYSMSLEELIGELTPVIRGWNNYHKATRPVLKRLRKLNTFVRERLRIFLKRKYSDQSRGTWRVHNPPEADSTGIIPVRLNTVIQRQRLLINTWPQARKANGSEREGRR
jgi:hypothetical protein